MRKWLATLLALLLLLGNGVQAEVLVDDGIAMTETCLVEWGYDYLAVDEVALYLHVFAQLPPNYLTKNEARDMGWQSSKGNLWELGENLCIGGDVFGNREGILPEEKGRTYYECDVNYDGGFRDAQRIVFSSDGLIYFTSDHYTTFALLYEGFYDPDSVYPPVEEAAADTGSTSILGSWWFW